MPETQDPWAAEAAPLPDMAAPERGTRERRRPDMDKRLDVKPLAADCPVSPLGVTGQKFHFLDVLGQFITLSAKFEKGETSALFGSQIGWLDEEYPQFSKDGKPTGFNQTLVQRALQSACHAKGLFNPEGRLRGLGSHRGDAGELILHCGDELAVAGARTLSRETIRAPHWVKPGKIGRWIFPRYEDIPHPSEKARQATRADLWTLLVDHFEGWRWKTPHRICLDREDVSVFGWLIFAWGCMASVCGAMDMRPPLWITGPSGAGKSVLHKSLAKMIGEGWAIVSRDPTAAGITQTLGQNRLAVLFDEAEESSQNHSYLANILTLAKLAFDGGTKMRGSPDGKAISTQIFTAMQFSSVMLPNLKPEERNRMVIVEIEKFPPGLIYTPHPLLEGIAPRLRSRLLHQWVRFDRTREAYLQSMAAHHWNGREQDAFASLLAMGDLALFDDVPDLETARVHVIVRAIDPLLVRSRDEVEDHPDQCIDHLASSLLPSQAGKPQETVAQWIIKGVCEMVNAHETTRCNGPVDRHLQAHGMKLVNLTEGHDQGNGQGGMVPLHMLHGPNEPTQGLGFLAVAGATNEGMRALFKNSELFAGKWMQALGRLEHKVADASGQPTGGVRKAVNGKRMRFGGGKPTATVLVPLEAIVGMEDMIEAVDMDRRSRLGGNA